MELFTWKHHQHNCGTRTSSIINFGKKGHNLDTSIINNKIARHSTCEVAHCFICPFSAWLQHCYYKKRKLGLFIPSRENRQNLHIFNLWPVKYHTEKNSCANPTTRMLAVDIYMSQRDYPKSTCFYFVAI